MRRSALMLKTAAFVAIILALAQPRLTFFDTKVAVAILADTSRSVTEQDLQRASDIATQIERSRGRHWTKVIPFARSTRKPTPQERGKSWNLQYTPGDAGPRDRSGSRHPRGHRYVAGRYGAPPCADL